MKSHYDVERLKRAAIFYVDIWDKLGIKDAHCEALHRGTAKSLGFSASDFSNWKVRGFPINLLNVEQLWTALEGACAGFGSAERLELEGKIAKLEHPERLESEDEVAELESQQRSELEDKIAELEADKADMLRILEDNKASIQKKLYYYLGGPNDKEELMAALKGKAMSLTEEAVNRLGKHFDLYCSLGFDDVMVLGALLSGSPENNCKLAEAIYRAEEQSSMAIVEAMMNAPGFLKELTMWREIRNSGDESPAGNNAPAGTWEKKFSRKANALDTPTLNVLTTAIEYIYSDESGVPTLDSTQIDQLLMFKYFLTAEGKQAVLNAISFLCQIEEY